MRLLLTGGGTAGHVYPALSVAETFNSQHVEQALQPARQPGKAAPQVSLLYVGSATGLERGLVERAGLEYQGINVGGGVRGMGLAAVGNALGLLRGFFQALRLVRAFRPQAILATGGYVCAPVVLAGWLHGVPALVYLPDLEPGWAIRFLTPFARRVAVSVPESVRFFPKGKAVVTGYPVRPELAAAQRELARAHFGLGADDQALLVFGGSRGAQHINQVVAQALEALLPLCRVIHVCGPANLAAIEARRAALSPEWQGRYQLYAYLHEMPLALAAADLVVSRAGASVLGEFPAVGLPAILIPYAGGHRDQVQNAAYLAGHGAAQVIPDDRLDAQTLIDTVRSLLQDRTRLAVMAQAAQGLSRPQAAAQLAQELAQLGQEK